METTTLPAVIICPTCTFRWDTTNLRTDPLAHSSECKHPECERRLAACCLASDGGSSCLGCGRLYCKQHLRPTLNEKGRGICGECLAVAIWERDKKRKNKLAKVREFLTWLFISASELLLLGLLMIAVLHFSGALRHF